MKASVVIATHDRPEKLAATLACLRKQDVSSSLYEIIVVENGSDRLTGLPEDADGPRCTLLRMEKPGRSGARNRGAAEAKGKLLVFVDDDITVGPGFISAHLRAHERWPAALAVGRIGLPVDALATPFGRFRQRLEDNSIPPAGGPVAMPNFCTAANMSIRRDRFKTLGGFETSLAAAEDQDLALRHTAREGEIVFIPEATAIHRDDALDIRSYCARAESGARNMTEFCRRHPQWPDNIERMRINAPTRPGREPLLQTARKTIKRFAASEAPLRLMFSLARLLERVAPNSRLLDRTYRLLLGGHIFSGYRKGLEDSSKLACRPTAEMPGTQDSFAAPNRESNAVSMFRADSNGSFG